MPPILALILFSGFILFLLRLDHLQSHDITKALWIPTTWILVIGSKAVEAWLQSSAATPDSSPLSRVFLSILMLMALGILLKRQFDWAGALRANSWLIALILFMLVSILWSSIPKASFFRWVREIQAVFMAFVVLSEPSPHQAMQSILRRTTYILIPLSPLLIKYYPQYGIEYGQWSGIRMWIGVASQKNGLVGLCIISIVFLVWSLIRRAKGVNPPVWRYQTYLELSVLAMAIWLMGGPEGNIFYSATSIYALAAGLFVYLGLMLLKKFRFSLGKGLLALAVAVIIAYGIVSFFLGGSSVGSLATIAGRDSTLTGRTEVWARLLPVAMRSPIIGNGFGGFWTSRTKAAFNISGAHSGYLDILLGIGFIGIILTSLYILSFCGRAQRELSLDFDWGALCICYIIMVVVHNIAESSIDTLTSYMGAVILFLSVSSSFRFARRQG